MEYSKKKDDSFFTDICILGKKILDTFVLLERKNLARIYERKEIQATPDNNLLHASFTFVTMLSRIQDSLNNSITLANQYLGHSPRIAET